MSRVWKGGCRRGTIVRMRRAGETAALVDHFADFACRFSLQVGKLRTDAEKMAISRCDFDSGQNQKIIDWLTIEPHQAFFEQISDRVAGVVIGDGDAVQAFSAPGGNQIFRTGDTDSGKKRMRVQVDVKRHCDEASYAVVKLLRKSQGR